MSRYTIIFHKTIQSFVHIFIYFFLYNFRRRLKLEPSKQFGLLIDGQSIAIAIKNYADEFRSIAMVCDAVVCCRLSPLQKSEVSFL